MGFLDCNNDVLLLILGWLARDDLRAICLAHPRLYELAHPILYSSISFIWQKRSYRPRPRRHPIAPLVRTILVRPELAFHIRAIACDGRDFTDSAAEQGKAPKIIVSEPEVEEAVSFVARCQVPYRDTWIAELRSGTMDAYLAVLLSQLPRLGRLHLGPDFFIESNLIALVVRSILWDSSPNQTWPTNLEHLHAVSLERRVNRHSDWGIRNTANVLPFFYLTSLKSLSVWVDDPVTFAWPTATPPCASNLVSLRLNDIREAHLGHLLSVTPRLRSLHWTWMFHPDHEDQFNSPVVDLDLIMSALAHTKSTLTELTIQAFRGYALRVDDRVPLRTRGSMRALVGFAQLKKLTIPLVLLTGFLLPVRTNVGKCLPSNLEELTLMKDLFLDFHEEWDEVGYLRALQPWLENIKASTPHLWNLCLSVEYTPDSELGSEVAALRERLRELARAAGIELNAWNWN